MWYHRQHLFAITVARPLRSSLSQIGRRYVNMSLSLSLSLSLSHVPWKQFEVHCKQAAANVIPFNLFRFVYKPFRFVWYHRQRLSTITVARPLRSSLSQIEEKFITGQNEREETTQDAIFTKSAAFASYEINYLTYITATYTRAKRRWHGAK